MAARRARREDEPARCVEMFTVRSTAQLNLYGELGVFDTYR